MKAQLVGMPASSHRRLKSDLDKWASLVRPEIIMTPTPSRDNSRPIISKAETNDVRAKVEDGFVHLFIVPTRDWRLIASEFALDCRIVLLRFTEQFNDLAWTTVEGSLSAAVEFEQRWLSTIGPSDLRHALLLPPPSFEVASHLKDYWRKCDVYGDTSLIGKAHDMLESVKAQHRRKKEPYGHCWVDHGARQFSFDPARHALSREEREGKRRFRFCFELPRGFHFDVQSVWGENFSILDKHGTHHRGKHLNVDPWGSVR